MLSVSPEPSDTEDLQEVRLVSFSSIEGLNTSSLVLSAAGISHRIQFIHSHHIEMYVDISVLQEAQEELRRYSDENRNWPPAPPTDNYAPAFRAMAPLCIAGLVYMYALSGDWHVRGIYFIAGAGDSDLILSSGQYYRLITALTLHADIVHLMSNCLLGGFLLHFLLLTTGNGIGVFSVLVSSALANLINVLVHGSDHHFVGFSTAVFVVIGMLCTMNYSGKSRSQSIHFLMPVMAGLALLALLGSSGERTDLGAHLFGLLCGLLTGNIIRLPIFFVWRDSFTIQFCLISATLALLWLSWHRALFTIL
ncbi:rhomboid family intramembrane serine protease [Desulforhopalus sp. IMCC35007]|uniref:rhomboid family intramembrane serine protease n=1 Tax=Desulforhopalus sp. IMCC35007 TaxID=2569543 RepID=UPI0010AE7E49|nr:rhomboid family intramembrane serine protease [Desulforhopalus sp. IMCC35007]TKB08741.1 rhomboid family intramembrane serine protease [Desulforhopalus sp. IMCC35007]